MLNHVVDYAREHVHDSEIGFARREITWQFRLDSEGLLVNIEPLIDKKAKHRPKTSCPDMPNMRAGGEAKRSHFLVEVASAALLYSNDEKTAFQVVDDDKTIRRHQYFKQRMQEAAGTVVALSPISTFLNDPNRVLSACSLAKSKGVTPADWIKFCIGAYDPLQDAGVLGWWRSWLLADAASSKAPKSRKAKDAIKQIDLLTGKAIDAILVHPPIRGINKGLGKDGGDAQAPLVAMDKDAFQSYGLKSGANAAMSAATAQLYADGLSDLIDKATIVAGAKVAFWYRHSLADGDFDPMFALLNAMSNKEIEEASARRAAEKFLNAIRSGERQNALSNEYFAVTVSGLKGRLMVRDWMEGGFEELLSSSIKWFESLEMVGLSGERLAPDQKFETVVTCLLADRGPEQRYTDWVKPIGADRQNLFRVALKPTLPIPVTVLKRVVDQLRSALPSEGLMKVLFPKKNPEHDAAAGLTISRLYARMGLIKAYFVRQSSGGKQHMKSHLNADHPDPAYHCGRLLAVLAKLQQEALGDVGAGVVQRNYPAFSQAPALHVGRLISNVRNHLGKIKVPAARDEFDERIEEIMGRIVDRLPRTLDLEGQGLFALGYYQQLADLRTSKKDGKDNSNQNGA